jgi:fructose-1-phosphate kinase PfkB-like protein
MQKFDIIALGPNPAWQKTLFFDNFRFNKVNRASLIETMAAGKGINFTRAAGIYGIASAIVLQFCGGSNGKKTEDFLRSEGMDFYSVETAAETRCCTTCLSKQDNSMTELIEPSGPISMQESDKLLAAFAEQLKNAKAVAFCGTTPGGTDKDFYFKAMQLASAAKLPVLLDAFKDIDDILSSDGTIILKINREELEYLTSEKDVRTGLQKLFNSYKSIAFVAITDGPDTAYAFNGTDFVEYTLPRLDEVVNPIGCGDTASAVLMSEIINGRNPIDAFTHALAAASANALNSKPGFFEAEKKEKIFAEIQISFK